MTGKSSGSRQAKRVYEPLHDADTAKQTVGCRHTNPEICAKNALPTVCAFARNDGMCLSPPMSWSKQFEKLLPLGPGRSSS